MLNLDLDQPYRKAREREYAYRTDPLFHKMIEALIEANKGNLIIPDEVQTYLDAKDKVRKEVPKNGIDPNT